MKNENPGVNRGTGFAMVFVLLALTSCHQVNKGQIPATIATLETIVFEGTLEKLGPDRGTVSGIWAAYRLAKYRVDKVCEGEYDGREIVVDHLVFDLKEFEGIHVNDRVCVSVKISKQIADRDYADGIRGRSDDVKIFYIAHDKIKKINPGGICCDK